MTHARGSRSLRNNRKGSRGAPNFTEASDFNRRSPGPEEREGEGTEALRSHITDGVYFCASLLTGESTRQRLGEERKQARVEV